MINKNPESLKKSNASVIASLMIFKFCPNYDWIIMPAIHWAVVSSLWLNQISNQVNTMLWNSPHYVTIKLVPRGIFLASELILRDACFQASSRSVSLCLSSDAANEKWRWCEEWYWANPRINWRLPHKWRQAMLAFYKTLMNSCLQGIN